MEGTAIGPAKGKGTSLPDGGRKPEIGLLFILLVGMAVALSAFLPKAFLDVWRQLVMWVATLEGALSGFDVTMGGEYLTVNGFTMRIADECTALNYVLILATAIALYGRHTLRYRTAGIVCAIPLIVIINAFRLVVTGLAGSVSPEFFHFVHEYLWVALFALIIFGMWKLWVDGSVAVGKAYLRRGFAAVCVCSVAFVVLAVLLPIYAPLLAGLSSMMLAMFLGNPQAGMTWIGSGMESTYGGSPHHVELTVEFYNIAVFAGLAAPLQKKGDWRTRGLTLFSLVAVVILDAFFIANAMYIDIAFGHKDLLLFWFIEKGLVLALPFGLWWVVSSGSERKTAPDLCME